MTTNSKRLEYLQCLITELCASHFVSSILTFSQFGAR